MDRGDAMGLVEEAVGDVLCVKHLLDSGRWDLRPAAAAFQSEVAARTEWRVQVWVNGNAQVVVAMLGHGRQVGTTVIDASRLPNMVAGSMIVSAINQALAAVASGEL